MGPQPADLETDPSFPSGPWTGFFLQRLVPGRHQMEIKITFRGGVLSGSGRDLVGTFSLQGRYELANGHCSFMKSYLGKHSVSYQGYNEGKGIWGTWEIPPAQNMGLLFRGGFHIWPEGMANPSGDQLSEEADLPVHVEELAEAVTVK